jgi:hypothetical protein
VGAASDEVAGRFEADAAVCAGYDEGASGLLAQLPWIPGHAGKRTPAERPLVSQPEIAHTATVTTM